MKLPFENWTLENQFSVKVLSLFQESIICYKHGAYRASLLFSYLAFTTYIKECLIKGKKPDSIDVRRWNSVQSELQDDDKWEKRVFDELNNSSSPIFNVKEDLRQQIRFWKDRRNDCAHFKNNEIKSHHIECFWSFLRSNLIKITIEGGKENLIKKFIDHFDTTKTPPNTDYNHLIKEIENAVEIIEFEQFIVELDNALDPYGNWDSTIYEIFSKIIELGSNHYIEATTNYLKKAKRDIDLMAAYPETINSMNYSSIEIRELWKKRIFENKYAGYLFLVFAALVRNNLIPSEQLDEAYNNLFENFEQTKHRIPPDNLIKNSIKSPILGDIIFNKAILENELKSFMWVNSKCGLISFYIENYPLKGETVEKLCLMFEYENFSWWLRDAVVSIFSNHPEIKNKFKSIANNKGFEIPSYFQ